MFIGHTITFLVLFVLELRNQNSIVLQTWKVASQQCESYGWEERFTGMTDSSHVWTPDLGDKLGDHLGDFGGEIWDLKGAGIFSISLLAEEIRLNVLEDSM
ncbi:hypothetical protein AVEN_142965-1 [Araneus ventricosus]|uniref:Neurotransmitter-gated ion-channel ligand-binding domain-containing protein n=1 Tax=Araneus ventricosus TaxID=182803 RepID=A0A4Y2MD18_ARAVE|nr:hypothetical protein AVEN_142965-1 [Araneus ventricosus]